MWIENAKIYSVQLVNIGVMEFRVNIGVMEFRETVYICDIINHRFYVLIILTIDDMFSFQLKYINISNICA